MKSRILLIGGNGQIGHELAGMLPRIGEVVAPDRAALNLSSSADIIRVVRETRPQVIVNAAAYTAVDLAEKEPEQARTINADAPRMLAIEALKLGACLVHYSTDYVFDGSKHSPYVEDDPTNPLSVYGKSKLEGEQAIRESGCSHLILRTAWVYATRGKNFLLTILRLASQREELRIVNDQHGAPTWAREIARTTCSMIERDIQNAKQAAASTAVRDTIHLTATGATTWCKFAVSILEEAEKLPPSNPWLAATLGNGSIVAKRVIPITTAEYPLRAQRPPYSVLSNAKLKTEYGLRLLDWQAQLHAAIADKTA